MKAGPCNTPGQYQVAYVLVPRSVAEIRYDTQTRCIHLRLTAHRRIRTNATDRHETRKALPATTVRPPSRERSSPLDAWVAPATQTFIQSGPSKEKNNQGVADERVTPTVKPHVLTFTLFFMHQEEHKKHSRSFWSSFSVSSLCVLFNTWLFVHSNQTHSASTTASPGDLRQILRLRICGCLQKSCYLAPARDDTQNTLSRVGKVFV